MTEDVTALRPRPTDADHVRGSLDASVVITEFGDFECPYCGDAFPVLEDVLKKYEPRVSLVFRHYPLPMHPHAAAAAEAAEAAADAGKFWEMHDELYGHQKALSEANFRTYAEAIGVEATSVARAIRDQSHRSRIERDVRSGNQSNIEGTPALFINGFAYDGNVTIEELSEVIDRVLG